MHRDRLDGKDWQREGLRALGLVLLASFVVRLYLFFSIPVIARDGALSIGRAQLMAQGAWRQAVAGDFEPLFPFSIFILHSILPDWEMAGKLTSLAFGVLALVPFFLISRHCFGPRIAFGAGILFALQPYFARNSAEALTESPYLFFLLMSLWLALKTLNSSGMRWYLLCAVAILLTRLTRIEGIWLFPVILGFLALRLRVGLSRHERTKAGPLLRLSFAFLIIMLPLFVYGPKVGGTSELSAYKGFGWLTTVLHQILDRLNGLDSPALPVAFLWEDFFYKFIQTFHPLLLVLATPSVLQKACRRQYRDHFLLTSSVALIYLGGPFMMWLGGTVPSSHRYFMAPVAVALPWAAVTIGLAADWLDRSDLSERWRAYVRDGRTTLLVVVALILAAKTVKPQRLEKLPIKEAGAWIAAQQWKDPVIMAEDARIAFYAKGRILPISDALENKIAEEQLSVVRKLIGQATSQEAQFIFLDGSVDRETQKKILTSAAVDRIMEWPNRYGDVCTLIQVKRSTK